MHSPYQAVPFARSAPIADRQLDQLIQIAEDANHGNTDPARADWLMSVAANLLRELAARRAFMGSIKATVVADKIVFFPSPVPSRRG